MYVCVCKGRGRGREGGREGDKRKKTRDTKRVYFSPKCNHNQRYYLKSSVAVYLTPTTKPRTIS
jgi:hypothetical protein